MSSWNMSSATGPPPPTPPSQGGGDSFGQSQQQQRMQHSHPGHPYTSAPLSDNTPTLNHLLQSSNDPRQKPSDPNNSSGGGISPGSSTPSSSYNRDDYNAMNPVGKGGPSPYDSSQQQQQQQSMYMSSMHQHPHQQQQVGGWGSHPRGGGGHPYMYQPQGPGPGPAMYPNQLGGGSSSDMSQGRRPPMGGSPYPQPGGGPYMGGQQMAAMGPGGPQRFMMPQQMPNQMYNQSQMYMSPSQQHQQQQQPPPQQQQQQQQPAPSVSPAVGRALTPQLQQMQNMISNSPKQPSPAPSISSDHGSTQSSKPGEDNSDIKSEPGIPLDDSADGSQRGSSVSRNNPAPSPVGSTGSRSNTPASIPGTQSGSPMPVRPPSGQIDGQTNRMTQSPMATQGYNPGMMPPPNNMGYMPNSGKMPGHYPQYNASQYPPQGNYNRQQPGMGGPGGMSGPMGGNYHASQQGMYPNGPSQMQQGNPGMYGNNMGWNMPPHSAYGPNPYQTGNNPAMMGAAGQQYPGYGGHVPPPMPGQPQQQPPPPHMQQQQGMPPGSTASNMPPGSTAGAMPPNIGVGQQQQQQPPQQGSVQGMMPQQHQQPNQNKAAQQAAQVAMMAANNSMNPRMPHNRNSSMSPSRGMFGGGPLAQMNNMTNSPNLGSPSLNSMSNAVEQLSRSASSTPSSIGSGSSNMANNTMPPSSSMMMMSSTGSIPSPGPKNSGGMMPGGGGVHPGMHHQPETNGPTSHPHHHPSPSPALSNSDGGHESLSRPNSTTAIHPPDLPSAAHDTTSSESSSGMPSDSTSVDSGFHSSDQGEKTSDSSNQLGGNSPPLPAHSSSSAPFGLHHQHNGEAGRTVENITPPTSSSASSSVPTSRLPPTSSSSGHDPKMPYMHEGGNGIPLPPTSLSSSMAPMPPTDHCVTTTAAFGHPSPSVTQSIASPVTSSTSSHHSSHMGGPSGHPGMMNPNMAPHGGPPHHGGPMPNGMMNTAAGGHMRGPHGQQMHPGMAGGPPPHGMMGAPNMSMNQNGPMMGPGGMGGPPMMGPNGGMMPPGSMANNMPPHMGQMHPHHPHHPHPQHPQQQQQQQMPPHGQHPPHPHQQHPQHPQQHPHQQHPQAPPPPPQQQQQQQGGPQGPMVNNHPDVEQPPPPEKKKKKDMESSIMPRTGFPGAHYSEEPNSPGVPKSSSDISKLFDMGPEPDRRPFLEGVLSFLEESGQPITSMPSISKTHLDLYKLYYSVREKGGFEEVTRNKKWREVCTVVNIGTSASAAFTLKKNYIRYLFNYECKFDRGGVNPAPILAQMEAQMSHKRDQKNKRVPSPGSNNSNDAFRPPSTPNSQMDGAPPFPGGMPPPYMQNPDGNMMMGPGGPQGMMGGPMGPNMMGHSPGMMGGPPGPPNMMGPGQQRPPGMGGPMMPGGPPHPHPHPGYGGPHPPTMMQQQHHQQQQQHLPPQQQQMPGVHPGSQQQQQQPPVPQTSTTSSGGPPLPAAPMSGPHPPSNSSTPTPTTTPSSSSSSMPPTSDSVSVQDPFSDESTTSFNRTTSMPPVSTMTAVPPPAYATSAMSTAPSSTGRPGSVDTTQMATAGGRPNDHQPPVSGNAGVQFPFGQQFDQPDRFDQSSPSSQAMRHPASSGQPTPSPAPPSMTPSPQPTPTPNNDTPYQQPPPPPPGPGPRFPGPPTTPQSMPPSQYPPYHQGQTPSYPPGSPYQGYPANVPPPGPFTPGPRPAGPTPYGTPTPTRRFPDASDGGRDGQWSPLQRPRMQSGAPGYMSPGPPPSTPPMPNFGRSSSGPRSSPQARERYSSQKANKSSSYPSMMPGSASKKELMFPADSVEGVAISTFKRRKLNSKDLAPFEAWRLMLSLKSGLLAESTWALDTLNILLYDDSTHSYFSLSSLPGLLEVLAEHLRHCLMQIFSDFDDLEEGFKKPVRHFARRANGKRLIKSSKCTDAQDCMDKDSNSVTLDEKKIWKDQAVENNEYNSKMDNRELEIGASFTLKGSNYTLSSRKGLPVKFDSNPTDSSVLESKDWDLYTKFEKTKDHWLLGCGDLTEHIQTQFESDSTHRFMSGRFLRKRSRLEADFEDSDDGEEETDECDYLPAVKVESSEGKKSNLTGENKPVVVQTECGASDLLSVNEGVNAVENKDNSESNNTSPKSASSSVDKNDSSVKIEVETAKDESAASDSNHSTLCNGSDHLTNNNDSSGPSKVVANGVEIKQEPMDVEEVAAGGGKKVDGEEKNNCKEEVKSDAVVNSNDIKHEDNSNGVDKAGAKSKDGSSPVENGELEEPKLSPMTSTAEMNGDLSETEEKESSKKEGGKKDEYEDCPPPVLKAECMDMDVADTQILDDSQAEEDEANAPTLPLNSTLNNSSVGEAVNSNDVMETSQIEKEGDEEKEAKKNGGDGGEKVVKNEEDKEKDLNDSVSKDVSVSFSMNESFVSETEEMSASFVTELMKEEEVTEDEAFQRDDPPLCVTVENRDELGRRCVCISNILRSLSCVPGNESQLCKHAGVLKILGRLLLLHHSHPNRPQPRKLPKGDEEEKEEPPRVYDDEHWWWDYLDQLRENTLVILANICSHLMLGNFSEKLCYPLLEGLLHWVICPASVARDPLPTLSINSSLSPQRLVLEALCKLCIHETNVDLLLATPPMKRLLELFGVLVNLLADRDHQITREFSIVLLSLLVQGDSSVARAIALQHPCVSVLVDFLETAEKNALNIANQQGLTALQSNPEAMGTSLDMLRRAASILLHMARVPDNRKLFIQQQSRLLNLVMSQILDQSIANTLSEVLFECSQVS